MTTSLEAAWAALDAANATLHWYIGRPSLHEERDQYLMYAFDPAETPKVGKRTREWEAVSPRAAGELGVVLVMAECLREIAARRVPR